MAAGFWFNVGADSSAASHVGEDGSVTVISGNPDIGGSRASLALMAAEELGVDYDKVRPVIADTASIGFNFVTGGSRVTFATGLAVVNSVRDMIRELKVRAAKIWNVDPDGVIWENGMAKPAGANVGDVRAAHASPQLAAQAGRTGGPINGHAQLNVTGAGPGFGVHCSTSKVDADTGIVTVGRYTAAQDVGTAIHPSYVEGQLQGGAVQGIGWALNEEYIYNAKGRLENPGFLDYRMPVASDLPMIETILVEVPNPTHPYGVRGVGEVPIVPPIAAVGNAIARAIGIRMTDLPMSPPKPLRGARRGGADGWRRTEGTTQKLLPSPSRSPAKGRCRRLRRRRGWKRTMEAVDALYRYPVKSMMGEQIASAAVTARGLAGDRAYCLVDKASNRAAVVRTWAPAASTARSA